MTHYNLYSQLFLHMLKSCDFLSFNHKTVNLMYLENLVRYSPYFLTEPGFVTLLSQILFSEKSLLSPTYDLAQKSSILLIRICERIAPQQMAADTQAVQQMVENILQVIIMVEGGQ